MVICYRKKSFGIRFRRDSIIKITIILIIFAAFLSFSNEKEQEKYACIKKIEEKLFDGDKIDWDIGKIEFRFNGWEDVDSDVYTMLYYSPEASKERFELIKLDVKDGINPVFIRKSYGKSKDGRYIVADFELTSDKGEILIRILKTYNKDYVYYSEFEMKTMVYSFERMENYRYPNIFMITEEYENVRTDPVNSEIIDERTPFKPKGIIKEYDKKGNLTAKILRDKPNFQIHYVYLSMGKLYKIETFNGFYDKLETLWKADNLTLNEKIEAGKLEKYEKDYSKMNNIYRRDFNN